MIEDRLRKMMIENSGNLKEFSRRADIPYTTLRSILERGVMNANVESVLKITKTLGLNPEFLESHIITTLLTHTEEYKNEKDYSR